MNSYDYAKVIDSYCSDDWWDEGYSASDFSYDRNYYHHTVRFDLVHETEKAFLLGSRQGEFWCPRSLLREVEIKNGKITGLLWDGFKPEFKVPEKPIDITTVFDEIDDFFHDEENEKKREKIKKKIAKRLKKKKKKKRIMTSTPEGTDNFFLEWLGL